MSISTDLARLQSAKAAMNAAIQGKGVTVPDGAKLDASSDVTVEHGLGVVPSIIVVVPMPTGAVDKTNPIAFYIAKKGVGSINIIGDGSNGQDYTKLSHLAHGASYLASQWGLSADQYGTYSVLAVDAQKFVVKRGFGVRTILWFAGA